MRPDPSIAAAAVLVAACVAPPSGDVSTRSDELTRGLAHARGTPLRTLDVIPAGNLSAEQKVLVATLQGLAARSSSEQIYIDEGGPSAGWKDDLAARHGVTLVDHGSWSSLVSRFHSLGIASAYVLYDRAANPRSLTAATALAGPLSAMAVDAGLEPAVRALGVTALAADVRTRDEKWVYASYAGRFNPRLVAELSPTIDYHLRDYATMTSAFTFYDGNTAWRTGVLRDLVDEPFCFGYGQDEFNMVADASSQGVVMLPSDLAPNLAPLSSVDDNAPLAQATRAAAVGEPDVHFVTFLTSDGDNVAFNLWSLRNYFDHPSRGSFDMGYTISPSLVDLAPSVMRWYYDHASRGAHQDFFVAGPSGSGYMFPSRFPAGELDAYLDRLDGLLAAADLDVVNILDADAYGRVDLWDRYLARPHIQGLLYTGYGETPHGRISFSTLGKPIIEARDNLWAGLEEESTVIANINARPTNPRSVDGYSLVFVHVWTKDLSSIQKVVNGLHAKVRVVTPHEFVQLVAANLGGAANGVADGTYRLVNVHSGKALDVAGGSNSDGATVLQWPYTGSSNQRWVLSYQGDGYYKITALHSGKALDVADLATGNGGRVIQWSVNGGGNQLWRVAANGDGSYRLVNKHSGKVLEVYGASTSNGAAVDQWSWGNANNQKWRLSM